MAASWTSFSHVSSQKAMTTPRPRPSSFPMSTPYSCFCAAAVLSARADGRRRRAPSPSATPAVLLASRSPAVQAERPRPPPSGPLSRCAPAVAAFRATVLLDDSIPVSRWQSFEARGCSKGRPVQHILAFQSGTSSPGDRAPLLPMRGTERLPCAPFRRCLARAWRGARARAARQEVEEGGDWYTGEDGDWVLGFHREQ